MKVDEPVDVSVNSAESGLGSLTVSDVVSSGSAVVVESSGSAIVISDSSSGSLSGPLAVVTEPTERSMNGSSLSIVAGAPAVSMSLSSDCK